MPAWVPTLLSVVIVSLVSLVGAVAGMKLLRRHSVILLLVALAAGTLIGDAFIHLLPGTIAAWDGFPVAVSALVLGGFLTFFVLEVVLRQQHAHGEVLQADHAHGAGHEHQHGRVAPFGIINLVGDAFHNFIDGAVIAASYLIDFNVGLATTIAVVLHEIPQELGDFAVLLRAGMAPRKALFFNLLSALAAVLGAVIFLLLPFDVETMEKIALPIIAGGFLYIAAADLVPELHHHAGDRHLGNIALGLLAGIGLMFALLGLE